MRIHSIRVSNAFGICNDWKVNFNDKKLHDSFVFLLRGDSQKLKKLLLESIALAFFGRNNPEEKTFWDEHSSSEVTFETHSGVFSVSWSGVYHCLRDRTGRLISQSPSDVGSAVERLTGLTRKTLSCAIFPPFERISDLLTGNSSPVDCLLSGELCPNLLPLTKEVIRQKEALITASEQAFDSLSVPESAEEAKLQQELDRLQQQNSVLERDISENRRAANWLDEQKAIKEELNKLNQRKSAISAESARFEVKREILDKANKVLLIDPLYSELSDIRNKAKETSKALSDLVRNSSHLSERVRIAQKAFEETEKRFNTVSEENDELIGQANKANHLETNIKSLLEEIAQKRHRLEEEQNSLRNLQEEGTNLKSHIAQLNKKEQHLKKKMDDLSTDALLVNSYAEYENQLDDIDRQTKLANESEEKRKTIQKQIDQSKSVLLEIQSELSALKNEELLCHGELSVKEKTLAKLMSFVPLEEIQKEFKALENKNDQITHLLELNDRLATLFDEQAKEKINQDKTRHELRLSAVTLNAAKQSLQDKITIVQSVEKAFKFQELVLSLEEQRKTLINGKPCPLCGAIHHPYQTKLPFDGKIGEQLERARKDLADAQTLALSAEKNSREVQLKFDESTQNSKQNDEHIEKLRQEILNLATSLEIPGLREKKPVTWGSLIRQKATSLTAKYEDLKNKLDKITILSSSIEEFRGQVQTLNQKIFENRTRFNALESENKENNAKVQELTKIEKEANHNKSELVLLLERAFIRYGIKASTPALLRQNLSILSKRREQWLSWVRDHDDISNQLKTDSEKLEQNNNLLAAQRLSADSLDKEVSNLSESLRRSQKEFSDITASQSPEEMISKAKADTMEVGNQLQEAKSVLASRQEALENNQNAMDKLKEQEESLSKQLSSIGEKFLKALQEHGFNNEVSFTASRIPESQRLDLQKQDNQFTESLKEIEEQISIKNEQLERHNALALTTQSRNQLEEIFSQKNGELQKLTSRIIRAREAAARYQSNKQRRLREQKEIDRLVEEKDKWQALESQLTTKQTSLDDLVRIGYQLIAEFAKRQLHSLGYDWSVNFDQANKPQFEISEGGQARFPCNADDLSTLDKLVAEISMSLGLAAIASMGSTPDFLAWKITMDDDKKLENRLIECLKRLHLLGKQIGIFSGDHLPKGSEIGYVDLKETSAGLLSLETQPN